MKSPIPWGPLPGELWIGGRVSPENRKLWIAWIKRKLAKDSKEESE